MDAAGRSRSEANGREDDSFGALLDAGTAKRRRAGRRSRAMVYRAGACFVTGTTIVVDGGRLVQSGGRSHA
jgi:hypothetical protein